MIVGIVDMDEEDGRVCICALHHYLVELQDARNRIAQGKTLRLSSSDIKTGVDKASATIDRVEVLIGKFKKPLDKKD